MEDAGRWGDLWDEMLTSFSSKHFVLGQNKELHEL